MGVIFSKSESSQFISNCQANLTGGLEVINDLKSGSNKLMQAIDGKTLSGAAYNAGKGLFGELIIPTITRCGQAIEEMSQDLQRYISANQAIQAASTDILDEAKLEQKIRESETYRNTIKATADALNSQAFGILGMTNPVTAMLSLANQLFDIQGKLNSYVASLDQDIEKLKQDLRLLQNFVSETQGLFSNSLTNFKIAMQGVTVLGKLIVNGNGTYSFPKGMDKSWFTEKKKSQKFQNDQLTKEQLETFLKDGGQLMVYKDRAKVKMANQNDLASDISFADADVVIWYIVKDGVVINLAEHPEFKDLYRYLQTKGSKLNKDQYKTISFNQAEKMTVDSMGGIEGRIARFEYYFRPAENALAGIVAA